MSLALALLLATAAAAQAPVHCAADADCAAGYQCVSRKTACAVHPESSTCAERVCVRKPGGTIKDADLACKKDSDCAIVVFDFQCMYCARPGDYANGVSAAVNKKRAKDYEAAPTDAQTRQCAMAGPCAQTGEMKARCLKRRCAAEYRPRP